MACTIYKVKNLFWYMVLATVACTSVAGHTTETLTSGAKADKNANKLPESAALTSGDGVDKNLKLGLAPPSENTVEELTPGNGVDMNLELGLAPPSGNALEEFTTGARAGKNANNLPISAALATNDGVGEIEKILDEGAKKSLALEWSDEMMVRLEKMLLAGKKDVTQILTEVKEWNQESGLGFPIPLLFDKLSKHFTERELAGQLVLAQDKENVKETANMLADYQMMRWIHKDKYSGEDVFKLLWFEIASIDSPLFDTLISYMAMLDGKVYSYKTKMKPLLDMLKQYFSEQILFEWFNALAETPQGKIRASSLKQLLQSNMGNDWVSKVKGKVFLLGPLKRKDGEVPEGLQASIGRG
ncbi:unnamed protein product [Peronospora farinosa]|uniref:RxLR effector candidate protein n=1 Tax=Peronospora farinosa TaxID=134698 RepID=A0AAV0T6P4_9STRA|nr:unnamed protein product [Peronospora farinosa]